MGRNRRSKNKHKKQQPKLSSVPTYTQESMKDVIEEYDKKYGKKYGVYKPGEIKAMGKGVTKGTAGLPPIKTTYSNGASYYNDYDDDKAFGGTKEWVWKNCSHWRDKVEIEEGIVILASGYSHRPFNDDWTYPEVACYFDDIWMGVHDLSFAGSKWGGPTLTPDNGVAILSWQDYGLPKHKLVIETLEYLLNQAGHGKEVEIGCIGGHGRTGTALALMRVLLGYDATDSMHWVWENYCTHAIESLSQEKYIKEIDAEVNSWARLY